MDIDNPTPKPHIIKFFFLLKFECFINIGILDDTVLPIFGKKEIPHRM